MRASCGKKLGFGPSASVILTYSLTLIFTGRSSFWDKIWPNIDYNPEQRAMQAYSVGTLSSAYLVIFLVTGAGGVEKVFFL